MGLVDKKNSRVKRKTAEAPMTIKKLAASYKRTAFAGTLVALAILGDSFLYAALPVHYREVGISSSSMGAAKDLHRENDAKTPASRNFPHYLKLSRYQLDRAKYVC